MDLDALETVNSDVLGWITIPDSPISYPMVQGADNQYYLTRTWDKQHNSAGAIFLDWHVQADFSDFNTIIYGHRMRNNSMFGSLKSYRDAEYWRTHPDLYITTPEGVSRYRIFAAYEVSVLGTAYQMAFEDEDSRRDFLALCAEQSVIDTGTVPAPEDPVVTLSTCTGGSYANRWVVQATLAETFPAE